jgi:AraC-like DNA-binding protein
VTSWRIQLAAERLRETEAGIAKIAADVGYESEARSTAPSSAYRITPGRWREGVSPDPLGPQAPIAGARAA